MKASVFIATSLDGFIARENGAIDWLPGSSEPHGYDEFISSVDVIIIGRNTFETVLAFGGWFYGKKQVIVLSSRASELKAPDGAVCDFMSGDAKEIEARLDARGFKHAYVDGGVTIQRFLEAGLIQRLIITRIPVLLGSGIPLFGPLSHDVHLEHVATRSFKGSLVQSEYTVVE
jgi:dihydrofolate reductase